MNFLTNTRCEFGRAIVQNFYLCGIKHRKTGPYRPQINGKVERFWRTLEEDFAEGTVFPNQSYKKNYLSMI
ncbi:MAG: integrase core domain-containing protein [Heliobacteriaceae bacterium]|jgi:transposase InsO family protein|nr:integrase core domain-containing protein [Heliobacteriaceae bacterium]